MLYSYLQRWLFIIIIIMLLNDNRMWNVNIFKLKLIEGYSVTCPIRKENGLTLDHNCTTHSYSFLYYIFVHVIF